MSKQFLDLNAIERLNYMKEPYLNLTRKNIARQLESLELAKKEQEGQLDEIDFNYKGILTNIDKNLRSNESFMSQLRSYFVDPGFGDRKAIRPNDRNIFISFSSKVNFQFDSIINNLENILDDVKLYPEQIDYSQFNQVYKTYNRFLKFLNNKFKPFFIRADGSINLEFVGDTAELSGYLQTMRNNINLTNKYVEDIKNYARLYGDNKGKIGLGKIPLKHR